MRKQLLAAVGAGTAALLLVAPMPASAAAKPKVKVVSTAVSAPFNLDVSSGKIVVADGGANAIVKVKKSDGTVKTIVEAVGPDGVAVSKDRRYLAHTSTVGGEEGITASGLNIIGPKGTVKVDTLAYERANNPDAKLTYGFTNAGDCALEPRQFAREFQVRRFDCFQPVWVRQKDLTEGGGTTEDCGENSGVFRTNPLQNFTSCNMP